MGHDYENTGKIPLRQMLKSVREELENAVEEVMVSSKRKIYFDVESVEVELKVEATWKGGVEGGINLYALTLGSNIERTSGTTHTFNFILKPKSATGSTIKVSKKSKVRSK